MPYMGNNLVDRGMCTNHFVFCILPKETLDIIFIKETLSCRMLEMMLFVMVSSVLNILWRILYWGLVALFPDFYFFTQTIWHWLMCRWIYFSHLHNELEVIFGIVFLFSYYDDTILGKILLNLRDSD